MGMRKFMAWNFDKVSYSRWSDDGGTIEFRRPPGVTNPDDGLAWMELALYFIQAARELQGRVSRLDAQYASDVAGLERFIHDGLSHACGTPKPTNLQSLFHGKSGRIPPITQMDQLGHDSDNDLAEGQRVTSERGISAGRAHGLASLSSSQSSAGRGVY
ncbi:hypothetical protein F5883DRAFT_641410 [Diaporthe sp. PMI_573]|nr:hypothetical protein F5883DRAFT_641410 [Diaporthaceae sp. PMI_573]